MELAAQQPARVTLGEVNHTHPAGSGHSRQGDGQFLGWPGFGVGSHGPQRSNLLPSQRGSTAPQKEGKPSAALSIPKGQDLLSVPVPQLPEKCWLSFLAFAGRCRFQPLPVN
jgi:hypothetical protein